MSNTSEGAGSGTIPFLHPQITYSVNVTTRVLPFVRYTDMSTREKTPFALIRTNMTPKIVYTEFLTQSDKLSADYILGRKVVVRCLVCERTIRSSLNDAINPIYCAILPDTIGEIAMYATMCSSNCYDLYIHCPLACEPKLAKNIAKIQKFTTAMQNLNSADVKEATAVYLTKKLLKAQQKNAAS